MSRTGRLRGIGSHHSARPQTDEWLTPPHVIRALGTFDLDPAGSIDRPWDTANHHWTIADDGLHQEWNGRVWLNPPYSEIEPWMERLAHHGDGIALVFARCETRWWFDSVWPHATALLFLRGRLTFHHPDGDLSKVGHNAGGPSVLIAYGRRNADALITSGLPGAIVAGPFPIATVQP